MFALLKSRFVANGVKENLVPMCLVKHHVISAYEDVEVYLHIFLTSALA
jgi:hypothetical protein